MAINAITPNWLRAIYCRHLKYYLENRFDELTLVAYLFRKTGDTGVMLDVGSHFGESARPFLLAGWSVCGFEPDPNPAKQQALRGMLQSFSRFSLHDYAISDTDGQTLSFYASDESTGVSSLISFTDRHKEVNKVVTITIDSFSRDYGLGHFDFLKIDTEGNDLKVIKGCNLEKLSPKVILCEFEDSKTSNVGYDYRDLGDYLVEHGYVVYLSEWFPIVRYGSEHEWRSIRKYPCAIEDPAAWGNYIAMKAEYSPVFEKMLQKKYKINL
jgi:FkbM family methyltransferase